MIQKWEKTLKQYKQYTVKEIDGILISRISIDHLIHIYQFLII